MAVWPFGSASHLGWQRGAGNLNSTKDFSKTRDCQGDRGFFV
jgi:hypothetical protein